MTAPETNRRDALGLFAVAMPAAAFAACQAPATQDWRTKPVEQMTRADFIAEARFHVAALTDELERLGNQPLSKRSGKAFALNWWSRELRSLLASPEA